ncbi:hypothetical protein SAMN04488030_2716 [Aliiroseovarius halocynthiae]|uniref:Uncharacterized protein n=1 Tax=Aliiroseovarius halocynthiae TaxID=985055 RepID=A0A545SPC1_9RHOB|nr:hypothetical protein [Aliiroseovarius halocynthiae]TQV66801.1 hypothetical protein FIL88_11935 [Aliiroseovarius halocynthiae]SMR82366.1 hypothetical protein SAMN04488030_2716 [Aliiroseovarius halocynthiae]
MRSTTFCCVTFLTAAPAYAEGRKFECTSVEDGSVIKLWQDAEGRHGHLDTPILSKDAQVLHGLHDKNDDLAAETFLVVDDDTVLTFTIDFKKLTYDMNAKGVINDIDHGTCVELTG